MLAAHPFVLCFDRYRRKIHHLVAMVWATLTVSPFYKIEVKGLENLPPDDTPAVFVSNHQSFLDIYTLLTLGRSFKFISKTAIFLFPIIGWAMYLMGTIPLRRMDTRSQLKGAFSIAAKTGVPVVPITLLGTGKIMPAGMEGRLNCGSVKVVIHQPIEGNNPEALCSEARNVISNQLNLQGYEI
nr:1-acyl-sn-glycerol-3-phosphate acyltransferase 1, chloroplastic [Ipomoea batatas]